MKFSSISIRIALFAFLSTGLLVTGCKKDEETEQEVITTIVVHLTSTSAGIDQEFTWEDLDGDGGNDPVIDQIVLPAGAIDIHCHVHVYDKSKTPVADITEEIEEESADHLFTYTISAASFTIAPDDVDSNGDPFGLETIWATNTASTGTLNIRLYHEPTDKNNAAAPGGDVDFDVTFPVKIQ